MAYYIKANPKVAKYLGLEKLRNTVNDGNYLLWQSDIQEFGNVWEFDAIIKKIGALALTPGEAMEEQEGERIRPLPKATDERFI